MTHNQLGQMEKLAQWTSKNAGGLTEDGFNAAEIAERFIDSIPEGELELSLQTVEQYLRTEMIERTSSNVQNPRND